jgi:hypothetical protein
MRYEIRAFFLVFLIMPVLMSLAFMMDPEPA